MKKSILLLSTIGLILFLSACAKKSVVNQDPFFDSFYDFTRHIMSDEEIEIYSHLPDSESKAEFITEFWAKRDPDPTTEENENKDKFEERIEYANRWFEEHRGKKRGWDTLRGRILLQLGFPEERRWGNVRGYDQQGAQKSFPTEIWYYYQHQLYLTFVDEKGYGQYELQSIPATLLTAIDNSKFAIDNALTPNVKHAFKFEAEYANNQIQITIPTKRLTFSETGNQMQANFNFKVYVYKNYRKVQTFEKELALTETKAALVEKTKVTLQIPFDPSEPGAYHLDVIGKDLQSNQRYRNFCKVKR